MKGTNRSILNQQPVGNASPETYEAPEERPTVRKPLKKQYKQWNKKMKNALDQIRPQSRRDLDAIEKLSEEQVQAISLRDNTTTKKEAII